MSNSSVAQNTASVSNIGDVVDAARKAPKVREAREATKDVSAITLDDAVTAGAQAESAVRRFTESLTAMMLDSLSRKLGRGEKFEPNKDASKLPAGVTASNAEVMFTLMVRYAFKGHQVWLDTAADMVAIRDMPNGRLVEKDVNGNKQLFPDANLAAKLKACRDYVDSAYVWREVQKTESGHFIVDEFPGKDSAGKDTTIYVPRVVPNASGRMLPVSVTAEQIKAGRYPGAKPKAPISSIATARKLSAFIVKYFWDNERGLIEGLKGRDMVETDVDLIRARIAAVFGSSLADLETAYRAGRPVSKPKGSLFDRITANKELESASLETIAELARYFNNLHAQRSNGKRDAEVATGLALVGYGSDDGVTVEAEENDGAMPAVVNA